MDGVVFTFALPGSDVFVFELAFEFWFSTGRPESCSSRRIILGTKNAAATLITRIPRMKAPRIPTTHGHARRRLTSVRSGTYGRGGW